MSVTDVRSSSAALSELSKIPAARQRQIADGGPQFDAGVVERGKRPPPAWPARSRWCKEWPTSHSGKLSCSPRVFEPLVRSVRSHSAIRDAFDGDRSLRHIPSGGCNERVRRSGPRIRWSSPQSLPWNDRERDLDRTLGAMDRDSACGPCVVQVPRKCLLAMTCVSTAIGLAGDHSDLGHGRPQGNSNLAHRACNAAVLVRGARQETRNIDERQDRDGKCVAEARSGPLCG